MKILFCHNNYQQHGGEDQVVKAEIKVLRQHGHTVLMHSLHNDQIKSVKDKLSIALQLNYSNTQKNNLSQLLVKETPDIIHVHNIFPLLTPSIYDACIQQQTPVIQTLHNYRTLCSNALLMRDNQPCETCIKHSPYHAVIYKCYRNSPIASFFLAKMINYHRKHQTWQTKINRFIVLSQFAKTKFIEAGFPPDKIRVKPNFTKIPEPQQSPKNKKNSALFVGRFSPEKGISTLLHAWKNIQYPLQLAGDGSLLSRYQQHNNQAHITFLGQQPPQHIQQLMQQANFLIMPSTWYEGFPLVLIEAFAQGLPVICSQLGSMAEIVKDNVTGLHFKAGHADDLRDKIQWMINNPVQCQQMGANAQQQYLTHYTPQINVQQLTTIYQEAIDHA